MPRLSIEEKEQIKNLSQSELQQIVLKIMAKNQSVYDIVLMNYLDNESGEEVLYEKTKMDLDTLIYKNYKGFAEQLRLVKMLATCIKRINEFTNISKNKVLEADLLVYILEVPFSLSTNLFGTCFTQYDSKVGQIVKRLITVVTKKLHEDYRIEYVQKINGYLKILHRTSNHINIIYGLPKTI